MTFPLCLTVFALAADPAVPVPDEVVRDRAAFLPARKHQPLPGTAVGVLAGEVGPVAALDGRSAPADAVAFGRGGMSYRWVYLPAAGEPAVRDLAVRVGEKGDRVVTFPALDRATPAALKRLGVAKPFALVELE